MSLTVSSNYIYEELDKLFPNAKCGLIYNNLFELLVSVALCVEFIVDLPIL